MSKFLPFILLLLSLNIFAQTETLTNADVIEMSRAGLGKEIIIKKISKSRKNFDSSAKALIELKTAKVDDEIIAAILENAESKPAPKSDEKDWSENTPANSNTPIETKNSSPQNSLLTAKTIAIQKSSLNPSRQELEKALIKRQDWQKYNLTIVRYKETADLYIEIGRVPFSVLTHRYVFRIYDRRNGAVITAGETTSWGRLANNLAREITQKLNLVQKK